MSKSGKFVLGAILGAAAAALLTPVAGREARKNFKKAANKTGFQKLAASGTDLVNTVLENFAPQPRRKTKAKK